MSTIVVFGGTGYTGGNVVREAASRGHQVIAVSRSQPKDTVPGVRYEVGKVEDVARASSRERMSWWPPCPPVAT